MTAIYKDFQGALNFYFKIQELSRCVVNKKSLIKLHETLFVMYFFFVFALVVDLLWLIPSNLGPLIKNINNKNSTEEKNFAPWR